MIIVIIIATIINSFQKYHPLNIKMIITMMINYYYFFSF